MMISSRPCPPTNLRAAFVVQRYGPSVVGGAESLCRQVAERLSSYIEVHVLTSCALGYDNWANHFPAGVTTQNDVTVHRFPVSRERHMRKFKRVSQRVFSNPEHAYPDDEIDWLLQQGPRTKALLEHIRLEQDTYNAFLFFTYLYYPTVWGLPLVAEKSVLVPTAHDEAPIHLNAFGFVFHLPRHIVFLTDEERDFVHMRFRNQDIPWSVIGSGVDLPSAADGDVFRTNYEIDGRFALYVGRITPSKSCDEMFAYYLRFKRETASDMKLVLLGRQEMPIPDHKDIVYLGFVDEETKFNAYKAATVFIMPSRFESLSIVSLESLAVGTPLLANGQSEVLRSHCIRSNGGLYYTSYREYSTALTAILESCDLRAALGKNGPEYIGHDYRWDAVEWRYLAALESVATSR